MHVWYADGPDAPMSDPFLAIAKEVTQWTFSEDIHDARILECRERRRF